MKYDGGDLDGITVNNGWRNNLRKNKTSDLDKDIRGKYGLGEKLRLETKEGEIVEGKLEMISTIGGELKIEVGSKIYSSDQFNYNMGVTGKFYDPVLVIG